VATVPVARRTAAEVAARRRTAAPGAAKPAVTPAPKTVVSPIPAGDAARAPPLRRTARIAPAGALPPAHIPPEALVSPRHDKLLTYALGGSLLVHAVVLMIHFSPFDLTKLADKGPPLEVALVNAKTAAKPTKADILAQANLDGGGNTDADRRAKTPLPVLPLNNPEQQVAIATQKVETLEQQTRELMTQLRSAPIAAVQQKPVDAAERTELPTANELMQRTLEAMKLEAQVAKDMETYQKRPKRRFVGARAEEYRFARYVEDWRLRIERVGNLNYPAAAREQHLYGSLLLTVSIKSDGSVEGVEVNRSSGSRILDAAAVKIVEMSAPFAPFPPDIKRDTDILHVTRTWMFTKADELVSQ
jgi:protein TonB